MLRTIPSTLKAVATGSTYEAVAAADIGNLVVPLPSIDEQQAIAAFLDRETANIDALVATKEQLIELLQEKRAALITEAVTKGLNPSSELKLSGFDWLGAIPTSWRAVRLRTVISGIEQGWSPECEERTAEEWEWGVLTWKIRER